MKNNRFLVRDIFQRAAELLIAETALSLITSALAVEGIIPVSAAGVVMIGLVLLIYIAFVIYNSYVYLSLVMDKEQYFKVSLAAYAIVMVISFIIKFTTGSLYTWLFFPMRFLMMFYLGEAASLLVTHLVVLAAMGVVGIMVNPIIPVDKSEEELAEIGYVPGQENLWTEDED